MKACEIFTTVSRMLHTAVRAFPVPVLWMSVDKVKMSSTKKHRNFVSEPMGEKDVSELAGIGEILGGRLTEQGFDKAYVVLGQFLVLKKDEEMFLDWMKLTVKANSKQSKDCFNCLKQWCYASV